MTNNPRLKKNWIIIELTAARKNQGLSYGALARRMGVSKQSVWNWENGTKNPSLEHAIIWAVALGYHLKLTKPS